MLLLIALFFTSLTTTTHEVAAETYLTGSKTLQITDYSVVKQTITNKNCIQSDPFTIGSYQWAVEFYPLGIDQSVTDYVTVGVRLLNGANGARAMHTNRLKDWNTGAWSNSTPYSAEVNSFSLNAFWGQWRFLNRSDLEASSYLRNDTLVIKSSVWVVKGSSTALATADDFIGSKNEAQAPFLSHESS